MIKKYLILFVAAVAATFVAVRKIFNIGRRSVLQQQKEKDLQAAQIRLKVEHEINQKSDNDVRRDLAQWMRDE